MVVTNDSSDPCIVFASPKYLGYASVWDAASQAGFVEPSSEWGGKVDIDHVFPKSWALSPAMNLKYVRLFPVWAEINRGAGGGREKDGLKTGMKITKKNGIVFADELQVLKILGHPVGTVAKPEKVFGVKLKR